MKFVIQRVSEASVSVNKKIIGSIGVGYVVLIGISKSDTKEVADKLINKMIRLRIFQDENDKTNLPLKDVDGSLLLISQFTLYASTKKGNRPSFTDTGSPTEAEELYNYIVDTCKKDVGKVEVGEFGEHMCVSLINDGPFTILLDSADYQ